MPDTPKALLIDATGHREFLEHWRRGCALYRALHGPTDRTAMGPSITPHPGLTELLSFFAYDHLPPHLQAVSAPCHDLAFDMASTLPDGPELRVGLRKLLDAKDALVRQALVAARGAQPATADSVS